MLCAPSLAPSYEYWLKFLSSTVPTSVTTPIFQAPACGEPAAADSLGAAADPLGAAADPLGAPADPLGAAADPLGAAALALGAAAVPVAAEAVAVAGVDAAVLGLAGVAGAVVGLPPLLHAAMRTTVAAARANDERMCIQ